MLIMREISPLLGYHVITDVSQARSASATGLLSGAVPPTWYVSALNGSIERLTTTFVPSASG